MVLRLLLKILLCLYLSTPVCAWAVSPTAAETAVEVPATPLPGLSQLNKKVAVTEDFAAQADKQLQSLMDLSKQQEVMTGYAEQFRKLIEEIKPLGSPDNWYADRLNTYLTKFSQLRQNLDNLQQKIALRLLETETIHAQLQTEDDFWKAWTAELNRQDTPAPKQPLRDVSALLKSLSAKLEKTTAALLPFQESLGEFQREVSLAENNLSTALGKLRQATFRKNTYSFFSTDFHQLFTANLGQQTQDGLKAALKFDRSYLNENGVLIGLMLICFLLLAVFMLRSRQRLQEADEWHFILSHPLAAACFITVAFFWFWFPAPPPILSFTFLLLTTGSATAMAVPLLENLRQVRVLVLAAIVILLTSAFQQIALPQPLFRIYLACLAIIFIPLLVQQVLLSKKIRQPGEGRFFRAVLRIIVLVLGISLIAQFAGYLNFSSWLIQASFETGTVLLLVKMAVLVMSGAIVSGNNLLARSGPVFFREFGAELSLRLKKLLTFFIYGFSIFYLLPVWRLFATLNEGWSYFTELTIDVGEFSLSMQMLASAVIAFYLALQASWILQAISDAQILTRRRVDRGVRDAVKKLIHYAVVLIGFLFALSLLGLGLQNFVVLLGAFGVGIGFGLQDIVNNFLSGLILLFERPIKVGDGILIDGEYGTVTRIGLRSTIVESLDNAELIVPNSQIISQKVTNWTLSNRRVRITLPVGVAYGSDLEKVLSILTEAGAEHPDVLQEPKPTALFLQFGNSSLDFELRVWIKNVDNRPRIKSDLLLYIDRRFREADVEIPFPQQDIHLRSVFPGYGTTPTQK
ncbi:MAG TPA: mechanosensitive ion channel domain-containing protein [Malonomonas sp.]